MLLQTFLIAISVSMDAFAVSIGKGLTVKRLRKRDVLKTALWFGGFQALFPVIGYYATSTFSKYVTAVDHWIIFGLLLLIGGNMIREAFEEDEENAKETPAFDWRHMLPIALETHASARRGLQHRRIRRGREFRIHESQYRPIGRHHWRNNRVVRGCRIVHWQIIRLALAEARADHRRLCADSYWREGAA